MNVNRNTTFITRNRTTNRRRNKRAEPSLWVKIKSCAIGALLGILLFFSSLCPFTYFEGEFIGVKPHPLKDYQSQYKELYSEKWSIRSPLDIDAPVPVYDFCDGHPDETIDLANDTTVSINYHRIIKLFVDCQLFVDDAVLAAVSAVANSVYDFGAFLIDCGISWTCVPFTFIHHLLSEAQHFFLQDLLEPLLWPAMPHQAEWPSLFEKIALTQQAQTPIFVNTDAAAALWHAQFGADDKEDERKESEPVDQEPTTRCCRANELYCRLSTWLLSGWAVAVVETPTPVEEPAIFEPPTQDPDLDFVDFVLYYDKSIFKYDPTEVPVILSDNLTFYQQWGLRVLSLTDDSDDHTIRNRFQRSVKWIVANTVSVPEESVVDSSAVSDSSKATYLFNVFRDGVVSQFRLTAKLHVKIASHKEYVQNYLSLPLDSKQIWKWNGKTLVNAYNLFELGIPDGATIDGLIVDEPAEEVVNDDAEVEEVVDDDDNAFVCSDSIASIASHAFRLVKQSVLPAAPTDQEAADWFLYRECAITGFPLACAIGF